MADGANFGDKKQVQPLFQSAGWAFDTASSISSGVFAVVRSLQAMSSESGTTDTLTNLTGLEVGDVVTLKAAAGHTITVDSASSHFDMDDDVELSGDKLLTMMCIDDTSSSEVYAPLVPVVGGSGSGGSGDGVGYDTIEGDGTAVTKRDTANFVSGEGISVTVSDDAGDSETDITHDLDIDSLTADASPDGAADYVATYDASAGTHKKVLLDDLPSGGGGSSSFDGAMVVLTSNQSFNNTPSAISWDDDTPANGGFDTGSYWASANPTRITIPSTGYYRITAQMSFSCPPITNSYNNFSILVNGTTPSTIPPYMRHLENNAGTRSYIMTATMPLTASDYLELHAYTSSGTGSILAGNTFFQIEKLGT